MSNNYDKKCFFFDTKSHYIILDGLRGVAAIIVILFHVFEIFSGGNHHIQIINHGYLAVDFFFVLSGFVIGYAYDDRWGNMTLKGFFTRRLIRLHPMIILAMVIGAMTFYLSASPTLFHGISQVPVWKLLLVMVIGFTLFPVRGSLEIRGWGEMHPLNGPAWSLFYEYVGNILYALIIRKLSNKALAFLVFLAGLATVHLAVFSTNGDVIGGWSLEPAQIKVGLSRLLYPFFAGLLLSRIAKPGKINYAFLWCSLLVILILAFPRVGDTNHNWLNGIYDSVAILFLFPLIVYIGASGHIAGKTGEKICRFLGDISYPVYIIHYPLIYIYSSWVVDNKIGLTRAVPVGILLLLVCVAIAYGSLKLYDIPVRKWLAMKFITK
ncbi:MAG: acyltransferase [Paludibacteraceae bacterium]